MNGAGRNLELKARDPDPARSLGVCEDLGAEARGTLSQRDTYFNVRRGRLKLREEPDADAQLIAYERPDISGHKQSRYRIVQLGDHADLREALATVLGVRAVVDKVRRLFLYEGVRIHLDRVAGLGDFIELEGVAGPDDDLSRFERIFCDLRRSLGIRDGDLKLGSYCDLLEAGDGLLASKE